MVKEIKMKTFFKIAALAAIAALAVISCSPPDVPESHFDWWDEYNEQYDASNYTDEAYPYNVYVYADLQVGDDSTNNVWIEFPDPKADILKKEKPVTADLNFISFYTYDPAAAATANATPNNTTPTSLSELTGWTLEARQGIRFMLKLPVRTASSSNVVLKINGAKYTYSNGLLPDIDGNGVPGEAIYDDYYYVLDVTGITNTASPILPGNQGWTVTLGSIPGGGGSTDTTTPTDLGLAGASIYGISQADRDTILKSLMGGFKVEKFSDGKWSSFATASYDDTTHNIIAKNVSATHMNAYRVVFEKGSINLETSQTFYGVKQRIKIYDDDYHNFIYPNDKTNITRLEGTPGLYYNTTKRDFASLVSAASIQLYSHGSLEKNIVLKLVMNSPVTVTTPSLKYYYFKQLDLNAFKNNFKIFSTNATYIEDAEDLVEISIEKVEFKQETLSGTDNVGYNVIYITLDPSYKKDNTHKYFYVGDGFGVADNITVFSSDEIWIEKGFKSYKVADNTF